VLTFGSKAHIATHALWHRQPERHKIEAFHQRPLSLAKADRLQRYAAELVKAIDALLASDQLPAALAEWRLLVPSETSEAINLAHIKVRKIGRLSGHAWDQIELARAAAGGRLISLANAGPVFHGDHIVVIHDAQVFRRPDFFNWRYLAVHRTMGRLLARRAKIATVSAFSRNELAAMLGLSKTDIPIFPNSAEHFEIHNARSRSETAAAHGAARPPLPARRTRGRHSSPANTSPRLAP
jgi:hypothetical protein